MDKDLTIPIFPLFNFKEEDDMFQFSTQIRKEFDGIYYLMRLRYIYPGCKNKDQFLAKCIRLIYTTQVLSTPDEPNDEHKRFIKDPDQTPESERCKIIQMRS